MHDIAILAIHDVVPFDLSIPCEVFSRVRSSDPARAYRVRVCGEAEEVRAGPFNIRAPWGLEQLALADTVILPGAHHPDAPVAPAVLDAIRTAAARGARIASICSGAFVFAATGLLDGQRVATHWLAAAALAERYPALTVDPNVLFIDNGQFITSAGATAGIDMCLHLVRQDHGQAAAAEAARLAVAPLHREGGQSQFIRHETPEAAASLSPLLDWMQQNAAQPLTLEQLADRAGASSRTLNRRFKAQTGTTPLQWLLAARIRNAQALLETTLLSVDEIAVAVGFDGPASLRERFRRTLGVSPNTYRRTFRGDTRPSGPAAHKVDPLPALTVAS